MAINTTKRRAWGNPEFTEPARFQPPSFKAKGRGYFNRLPSFPATSDNANASLHNRATSDANGSMHKLYLFVDVVSTGWKVAGETAQTHSSRSFYPRSLTQDEIEIHGTVANQYEYDKLVRFVEHHHRTVLRSDTFEGDLFRSVEFNLFKPSNSTALNRYRPLKYRVVILSVDAGAERFKNAPTFVLRCKVLHDYMGVASEIPQAIDRKITYKEIFGGKVDLNNPIPWVDATNVDSHGNPMEGKVAYENIKG